MAFIDHKYATAWRQRWARARLWAHVRPRSKEECWPWVGQVSEDGYGIFSKWKGHVVMWELHNGRPVPPGMQVCHSCDNPSCINPHHLFIGTHQDNIDDKMRKGRHNCGRGPRPGIRGDRHWTRNVDHTAKYERIRALAATGVSQRAVARALSVGPGTVRKVLHGVV